LERSDTGSVPGFVPTAGGLFWQDDPTTNCAEAGKRKKTRISCPLPCQGPIQR